MSPLGIILIIILIIFLAGGFSGRFGGYGYGFGHGGVGLPGLDRPGDDQTRRQIAVHGNLRRCDSRWPTPSRRFVGYAELALTPSSRQSPSCRLNWSQTERKEERGRFDRPCLHRYRC